MSKTRAQQEPDELGGGGEGQHKPKPPELGVLVGIPAYNEAVGIGSQTDTTFDYCDDVTEFASVDALEPVGADVVTRLFASHLAAAKNRHIDTPRNLTESAARESLRSRRFHIKTWNGIRT